MDEESDMDTKERSEKDNHNKELFKMITTISIVHFSAFGVHHIKDIDIYESIKHFFKNKKQVLNKKGRLVDQVKYDTYEEFTKEHNWFKCCDLDYFFKNLGYEFSINNEFDVCIRLFEDLNKKAINAINQGNIRSKFGSESEDMIKSL